MPLATIEWGKLGELLLVAPVAAFVVGLSYALLILGLSSATECRRAGATRAAVAYSGLALAGGAGFFGAVVFGLVVITG